MKKIGMFLLAVIMIGGAAVLLGCGDDKLGVGDLAGTYTLASMTVTPTGGSPTTYTPTTTPAASGSVTITSEGTYSSTTNNPGGSTSSNSGIFTVDDPTIVFHEGADTFNGVISNGGRTITVSRTYQGTNFLVEWVRA